MKTKLVRLLLIAVFSISTLLPLRAQTPKGQTNSVPEELRVPENLASLEISPLNFTPTDSDGLSRIEVTWHTTSPDQYINLRAWYGGKDPVCMILETGTNLTTSGKKYEWSEHKPGSTFPNTETQKAWNGVVQKLRGKFTIIDDNVYVENQAWTLLSKNGGSFLFKDGDGQDRVVTKNYWLGEEPPTGSAVYIGKILAKLEGQSVSYPFVAIRKDSGRITLPNRVIADWQELQKKQK